ncbi:PfkB family carbohydrate kinase [Georgenia sp. MJ206]|uniref:PfkB family carbohydrate kinase n=1 Tax=Georgenia wangjunii TaxID=3117730 RepID=UPI002F26878B
MSEARRTSRTPDVVVLGQVARDLVLEVAELPPGGDATPITRRQELLGGKGANQAVAWRQLGVDVALVGVVGDDDAGRSVLAQAADDGIDVAGVVVRQGAPTALLVDVVEEDGTRRLLEDAPGGVLLTAADVRGSAEVLRAARVVVLQLQQPGAAILEALRVVDGADCLLVADGAAEDADVMRAVLSAATVLRADAAEAAEVLGEELPGVEAVLDGARRLVADGPRLVALEAGGDGNVAAWPDGHVVMPLLDEGPTVDPTGAGDAFVTGLVHALVEGADAETAAWHGSAAAALTVTKAGGRPDLHSGRVAEVARAAREPADRGSPRG